MTGATTGASTAFWSQLNLVTGLPDLPRLAKQQEPMKLSMELRDNQVVQPRHINPLLEEEYIKSIIIDLLNNLALLGIDRAVRRGQVARPSFKEKQHAHQMLPTVLPTDPVKTLRKEITYIQEVLERINLADSGISHIDQPGLKRFCNVKELNLVGNMISDVNITGLPVCLEMLHLNANLISSVPDFCGLRNLVHLGLAHNKITSLPKVTFAFLTAYQSKEMAARECHVHRPRI